MREDGGQAAFPVHVPGTLKTGTTRNLSVPATSMHGPSVLAFLLCWLWLFVVRLRLFWKK